MLCFCNIAKLTFTSLPVVLRTTKFSIENLCMVSTLHLCVLYDPQNKQQHITYLSLTDCVVLRKGRVFTARYGLYPYTV